MQDIGAFAHPFILNAAMILLAAAAYGPLGRRVRHPLGRQLAIGGMFGLMAIGCMSAPMVPAPGVFIDLRYNAILLAGPFGGPFAALVAGGGAGAYRLWLGGPGAPAGALAIGLSAILSIILHYWLGQLDSWRKAGLAGVLLVAVTLPTALLVGTIDEGWALVQRLAVPFLVALPVTSILVCYMIMRDERHREAKAALARSETKLRQVAEVATDWFWETDTELRFTRVTGHSIGKKVLDNLVGRRRDEVALDPNDPDLIRHMAEMRSHRPFRDFRHSVTRYDGGPRHVSVSGAPMFDDQGVFVGYVGSGRDVTAEVENEAALNEARREAVAANEAKSAFLANMSHEVRTPMTGLLGMIDILETTTRLDAEQTQCVEKVRASAAALLAIVNDILDLSKIEAGGLQVEAAPFELRPMLNCLCSGSAAAAAAKGLSFSLTVAPELGRTAIGDGRRIGQVLTNFLANAIRFTETGGIEVSVAPAGDGVAFAVTDTGIGIPEDKIEQIFRPFEQADRSTTRRFGGTGLGLAISRRLAEAMGGEATVRSTPGVGSTFSFRVPLSFAPTDEAASAVPADEDQPSRRVAARLLVAEDNALNALLLKTMLGKRGYEVTVVDNGLAAVETVSGGGYDVVLLDMHMPVMDGLEATRRIRALPAPLCDLPVFALTADALHQNRDRYQGIGLTEFLTKPIDWDALDCAIERHAGRRLAARTGDAASSPTGVALDRMPLIDHARPGEIADHGRAAAR